jgi:hypothetical protein
MGGEGVIGLGKALLRPRANAGPGRREGWVAGGLGQTPPSSLCFASSTSASASSPTSWRELMKMFEVRGFFLRPESRSPAFS